MNEMKSIQVPFSSAEKLEQQFLEQKIGEEHIQEAIQNVLVCLEMIVFSILQHYAFHRLRKRDE
ncbi:hypothetical protein RJ640_001954 [Escallonia rubra]|uniref:Uncharacterized protein n=1 Tax=Escallonia rubra TaxID=112253 RepID=A0AA88UA76_9ASTE|nr:hypothetical protein RJ640_001954 [Escallonia rubra]